METTYQYLVALLTVAVLMAASVYAYNEGYMDPLIEKFGVYFMKAEAEAEAKKMEAEGLKRGEDFLDSELKGNQQADEIVAGVGSFGKLKKNL
ncbi:hypothetical protein M406DRAFT_355560 [Cryphonectria parasitica EP155]|uniref:Uncharacterized protein n=1 Tax=Cryphonectria parasitica (strain ATCC 38755 / EP155) TaxID=660469 RepID=A0A9P4Y6D8_CRYP1|nr:uncharacterized protein M406DRAFT_355560 [Cryphonectria parasitica EP155]KAF3767393.1 hypothetical protein M406DRAFT_355560 [Cryphonectria parasitica EP155]